MATSCGSLFRGGLRSRRAARLLRRLWLAASRASRVLCCRGLARVGATARGARCTACSAVVGRVCVVRGALRGTPRGDITGRLPLAAYHTHRADTYSGTIVGCEPDCCGVCARCRNSRASVESVSSTEHDFPVSLPLKTARVNSRRRANESRRIRNEHVAKTWARSSPSSALLNRSAAGLPDPRRRSSFVASRLSCRREKTNLVFITSVYPLRHAEHPI